MHIRHPKSTWFMFFLLCAKGIENFTENWKGSQHYGILHHRTKFRDTYDSFRAVQRHLIELQYSTYMKAPFLKTKDNWKSYCSGKIQCLAWRVKQWWSRDYGTQQSTIYSISIQRTVYHSPSLHARLTWIKEKWEGKTYMANNKAIYIYIDRITDSRLTWQTCKTLSNKIIK